MLVRHKGQEGGGLHAAEEQTGQERHPPSPPAGTQPSPTHCEPQVHASWLNASMAPPPEVLPVSARSPRMQCSSLWWPVSQQRCRRSIQPLLKGVWRHAELHPAVHSTPRTRPPALPATATRWYTCAFTSTLLALGQEKPSRSASCEPVTWRCLAACQAGVPCCTAAARSTSPPPLLLLLPLAPPQGKNLRVVCVRGGGERPLHALRAAVAGAAGAEPLRACALAEVAAWTRARAVRATARRS